MSSRIYPLLYQFFAVFSRLSGNRKKFMNLGYDAGTPFPVHAGDETDAHHIALYSRLLKAVPGMAEAGADYRVLEVGCGRGGGCYVLQNYFGIKTCTGIDISTGNIGLAQKLVPGATFAAGNADTFTFPQPFDLVLNLESSHTYPSRLTFFKRVAAVMQSRSYFAFGDVMRKEKTAAVETMLGEAGFEIVAAETVNPEVVRALEKRAGKTFPLASRFPKLVPKGLHNFFVTKHSDTFRKLASGEIEYRLYVLRKRDF
jgi:SAM-dependent methyltransferase